MKDKNTEIKKEKMIKVGAVNGSRTKSSQDKSLKCIRITSQVQKKLEKILLAANKKKFGRKVKAENVLTLAMELVTSEHIQMLQEQSLTNEDRLEQLKQIYISKNGPISKDGWIGFMLGSDFQDFLAAHSTGALCGDHGEVGGDSRLDDCKYLELRSVL